MEQCAILIALGIVELAAAHAPDKGGKTHATQKQGNRNQGAQDTHVFTFMRNAFRITTTEDPDIARAAISGVTKLAIANGIAIAL